MSLLTYNGVTLPYPFHTSFRQEAVYDDMGGTDWFCTKFDITTQSLVNANYLSSLAPNLVGASNSPRNAVDIMNVIRAQLLKPRQAFQITFNGVNLIPQSQLDPRSDGGRLPGNVDAQNGPKPQSCVITTLTNTSFLITYHIIAHYWESSNSRFPVDNQAGNNVLFNRWDETIELDNTLLSTRTRNGKYVIRSDNKEGKIAAQIMTQMAVVGVPPKFLRQSSRYTVSPDGLAISYNVVDKEQYKMPPEPAYEAEGEYIETTVMNGAQRFGEVRVRLKGTKTTKQDDLIRAALDVASRKIGLKGAPGINMAFLNKLTLIENSAIRVNLYDSTVEFRLRARMKPGTNMTGTARVDAIWGLDVDKLAFTPGSDGSSYQPHYSLGQDGVGTQSSPVETRLLRAAAYYDPTLTDTKMQNSQLTHGLEVGQAGKFTSERPPT